MIQQQADKLDSNARLLLQQAVLNPSLLQLFLFEKIATEKLLLSTYQTDTETDSKYLRKLEILRNKIIYIDEWLAFFNAESKK